MLAGCGRVGFDDHGDGAGPVLLPCGIAGTTIGDVCPDGTVYAGVSPDGNVPMYVRRCDLGMSWSGTQCTGTRMTACFNNCNDLNRTRTDVTDLDRGAANTNALLTIDSDSGTPGIQPHQAAMMCATFVSEGHGDWYLPAKHELDILHDNRLAIGGFEMNLQSRMFSSTEATSSLDLARFRNFFQEEDYDINKFYGLEFVRCVRK